MSIKVSVVVITYNSSGTVIETLNSILNQSYKTKEIELIISDDCSSDNTKYIINSWLEKNSSKFGRVNVLNNDVNLGITSNCNRAWARVTTPWIKTIAGDDILEFNCIKYNIRHVDKFKTRGVVFSCMKSFDGSGVITQGYDRLDAKLLLESNADKQLICLLRRGGISGAPSAFISTSCLNDVGFADEAYKYFEDYPLWFKMLKSGYTIDFLRETTVRYRIGESISKSNSKLFNFNLIEDTNTFDIKVLQHKREIDFFTKILIKSRVSNRKNMMLLARLCGNDNKRFNKMLLRIISAFSIYRWYVFLGNTECQK